MFYFCIFNYLVPIALPTLVRCSPRPLRGGVGGGVNTRLSYSTYPSSLFPISLLLTTQSPPPYSLDISLKIWQFQKKVVILHT